MSQGMEPKLVFEGPGAILIDGAGPVFDDGCQSVIWRLAHDLLAFPGVLETVPGMNNLLVTFDPLATRIDRLEQTIRQIWQAPDTGSLAGRIIDVPVRYGGEGTDLADFAAQKGLSIEDVVGKHTAPLYSVAAVGAMPGFVYLSGLHPSLATPRHINPRGRVAAGSVMIGGAQTGIMPITAPSGWHILGKTDLSLFDPEREPPALFQACDRLKFVATEILR